MKRPNVERERRIARKRARRAERARQAARRRRWGEVRYRVGRFIEDVERTLRDRVAGKTPKPPRANVGRATRRRGGFTRGR